MAEEKIPKIDVSKIKNMQAIKEMEPEVAKVLKKNFKQKDNKFKFTEPERIQLPSKGRLYAGITTDEDILNGFIFMYPMTAKEEEIITTPRFVRTGVATRMVLDNCIASDISAKDLLAFDSNFLLYYLRQISYGDEYKFGVKCTNCGKQFRHTVNISELAFEELDENITEPLIINLPKSKYSIELVIPRVFHSEIIYQQKNNSKKDDEEDEGSKLLSRVKVTTLCIKDQNGLEIPKKDWNDFYSAIPAMDRAEISEHTVIDTGIDELKRVECPHCGDEMDLLIPMGIEFFRLG